jgi:hypothetical protein
LLAFDFLLIVVRPLRNGTQVALLVVVRATEGVLDGRQAFQVVTNAVLFANAYTTVHLHLFFADQFGRLADAN